MNLENITNSHITEVVSEYIHNKKHREILLLRYVDGYTFEKIAEIVDMSTVQIKRIVYKNEMTLFKHL